MPARFRQATVLTGNWMEQPHDDRPQNFHPGHIIRCHGAGPCKPPVIAIDCTIACIVAARSVATATGRGRNGYELRRIQDRRMGSLRRRFNR